MGKGDIKSKRGKIARGTYGSRRKKSRPAAVVIPTPKPAKVEKAVKQAVEEKPKAAKKPAAAKADTKPAAAKKPAAKKAVKKDSE